MARFRRIDLTDSEWGRIKLLVAIPTREEPWGALAALRGTPWEDQIQVMSGELLSHALHGYATPMMRSIGAEPRVRARRISNEVGFCALLDGCAGAGDACRPGPKTPDCYEAPGVDQVAIEVALAWREGRYVLVVEGSEFSY